MTTCGNNLDFGSIRRRKNKTNKHSVCIRPDNKILEIDKSNDSCDDIVNVTEYDSPDSPPEVCINIFDLMNLHVDVSEKENVENFSFGSDFGYGSASPSSLCDNSHSSFRVTDTSSTAIPNHNLSSPVHSPMYNYEEEPAFEKKEKKVFRRRYDDLLDLSHILKKTLVISCEKLDLDEFCKKNRFTKTGDQTVLMKAQPVEETKFHPIIEHIKIHVDKTSSGSKTSQFNESSQKNIIKLNRTNELTSKVANKVKAPKPVKDPKLITLEMLTAGLLQAKITDADHNNVVIKTENSQYKVFRPPPVVTNTNFIDARLNQLKQTVQYDNARNIIVNSNSDLPSVPEIDTLAAELDISSLDLTLSNEEISAILPNTVFSQTGSEQLGVINSSENSSAFERTSDQLKPNSVSDGDMKSSKRDIERMISNELDEEGIISLLDSLNKVCLPTTDHVESVDEDISSVSITEEVKRGFDIIKEMETIMMNAKPKSISKPPATEMSKSNILKRARMINTAAKTSSIKVQNKETLLPEENVQTVRDFGCSSYNASLDCLFGGTFDEFDFSDDPIISSDNSVKVEESVMQNNEVSTLSEPKEKFHKQLFTSSTECGDALSDLRQETGNVEERCHTPREKKFPLSPGNLRISKGKAAHIFEQKSPTDSERSALCTTKGKQLSKKKISPTSFKEESHRHSRPKKESQLSKEKSASMLKGKSASILKEKSASILKEMPATGIFNKEPHISVDKHKKSKHHVHHGDKRVSKKNLHVKDKAVPEPHQHIPTEPDIETGKPTCESLPEKITLKISRLVKKNKTSFSILKARSKSTPKADLVDNDVVDPSAPENDTKPGLLRRVRLDKKTRTKSKKLSRGNTASVAEQSSNGKCMNKINSVCSKDSINANSLQSDFDSRSKVTGADVGKKLKSSAKDVQNKTKKSEERPVHTSEQKSQANVRRVSSFLKRRQFSKKFNSRSGSSVAAFCNWKERKKKNNNSQESRLIQTTLPFTAKMTSEESSASATAFDDKTGESNKIPEKDKGPVSKCDSPREAVDINGAVKKGKQTAQRLKMDNVMEVDVCDIANAEGESERNSPESDSKLPVTNGSHFCKDLAPESHTPEVGLPSKQDNTSDNQMSEAADVIMGTVEPSGKDSSSDAKQSEGPSHKSDDSVRVDGDSNAEEFPCKSAVEPSSELPALVSKKTEIDPPSIRPDNSESETVDPCDKHQSLAESDKSDAIPERDKATDMKRQSDNKPIDESENVIVNVEIDSSESDDKNNIEEVEKLRMKQDTPFSKKAVAKVWVPSSETNDTSELSSAKGTEISAVSSPLSTTPVQASEEETPQRSRRQKVSRKRYSPPLEIKPAKPPTPVATSKSTMKAITPISTVKSPAASTPASGKKKYNAEDVAKPFLCGWMREVVHRASGGTNKKGRAVDIYYFTPEGSKLRSMPEVTKYLAEHKPSGLSIDNFTFAKETVYRHPFEKERGARARYGDEQSPVISTPSKPSKHKIESEPSVSGTSKQQKTQSASITVSADSIKSEAESSRTLDVKKPSSKTARKTMKISVVSVPKAGSKEVPVETPSKNDSSARLSGEDIEDDVQQLTVTSTSEKRPRKSTKRFIDQDELPSKKAKVKISIPKKAESKLATRCTSRCPAAFHQVPTLQCKVCLCMSHRECVAKNVNFTDFTCKSCQEEKPVATSSDPNSDSDLADGPPILPEISLQLWFDEKDKGRKSILVDDAYTLPPPPPLQRAPESNTLLQKSKDPASLSATPTLKKILTFSHADGKQVSSNMDIVQPVTSSSSSALMQLASMAQSVIPTSASAIKTDSTMQSIPIYTSLPSMQPSNATHHPAMPPLFMLRPQGPTFFPQGISRYPPMVGPVTSSNNMPLRLILPNRTPLSMSTTMRPSLSHPSQRFSSSNQPIFATLVKETPDQRFMQMNYSRPGTRPTFTIRNRMPTARVPMLFISNAQPRMSSNTFSQSPQRLTSLPVNSCSSSDRFRITYSTTVAASEKLTGGAVTTSAAPAKTTCVSSNKSSEPIASLKKSSEPNASLKKSSEPVASLKKSSEPVASLKKKYISMTFSSSDSDDSLSCSITETDSSDSSVVECTSSKENSSHKAIADSSAMRDEYLLLKQDTNPPVKPPTDSTAKQSTNPPGKPVTNPPGKPAANPSGKSATNPSGKSATNPSGKPVANLPGKPATNPSGKHAANPSSKPAANPPDKLASKMYSTSDKQVDNKSAKESQKSLSKLSSKKLDSSPDKPALKPDTEKQAGALKGEQPESSGNETGSQSSNYKAATKKPSVKTSRHRKYRSTPHWRKHASSESDNDASLKSASRFKRKSLKSVETSSKSVECNLRSFSFPTFPKNPDINTFTVGYECLNMVFKKMKINDLLRIAQVSKSWQCLATQRFLWQNVNLQGLLVKDWNNCSEALKRNGTKVLNLRGIMPNEDKDAWKEFTSGLNNLVALEHLTFGQVPPFVIEAVADKLPLLQRLECFCLTTTHVKPDLWTTRCSMKFFNFRFLKKLKRLKIRSAGGLILDSEPTELKHLPDLQHLSLTSLKEFPSSHFNFLSHLSSLVSLELGDCSSWLKENYVSLSKLVKLQQLRLENGGGFDVGLAEALQQLERLEDLELMRFIVPENLGTSLEKLTLLRKFILWPDNSDEAAQINYNAFQSVIKLHQVSYFCWGIISPDDCIPLLPMLKDLDSEDDAEDCESADVHYEDLFERLCTAMPDAKVEMKCISSDFLNEYCSIQR